MRRVHRLHAIIREGRNPAEEKVVKKQVNPIVIAASLIAVLAIAGILAFNMFGSGTNPAKHEGDGKMLPRHFQSGTQPGAP